MSNEALKRDFIPKFVAIGNARFYSYLLTYAINKMVSIEKKTYTGVSPEIEFMDLHDQLIVLYRREGEQVCLDLAKVFRKAGHKIYRSLLKNGFINYNPRFLNLVS